MINKYVNFRCKIDNFFFFGGGEKFMNFYLFFLLVMELRKRKNIVDLLFFCYCLKIREKYGIYLNNEKFFYV